MNIDEILSITRCHCGRPYCDFFGNGIGEYGKSFSREQIKEMLEDLPEIKKHLQAILDEE